jgi:flagellar motility protein MotE (MotC chaperone)
MNTPNMAQSVRVMPAFLAAAAMLLMLKCISVWGGVSHALGGISEARANDGVAIIEAAEAPARPSAEGEQRRRAHDAMLEDEPGLSKSEVRVLQSLADRRAALDERGRELDMRERLLAATEKRVNERIAELRAIETRIEKLLNARDEEQMAQIDSLVSTYESMRPKNAARIFEELDEEVLLQVAVRMRERQFAEILANMNPASAQQLTVRLANRLDLAAAENPGQ